MIVQEYFKTLDSGIVLMKTYSNQNKYIQKIGTEEIYDAAVDPEEELTSGRRAYIETDKEISYEDEMIDETIE